MPTIQDKIDQKIKDFYNHPWSNKDFLTEDDVRCRLFLFLDEVLRNETNCSIHSEIRWYGHDPVKKLRYRSDLVIIDNTDLRVTDDLFTLPSKGYGFNLYYAIIEIKLRRKNDSDSDESFRKSIEADVCKLKEIKEKTTEENNNKYFIIAFDRKRNKKCLIDAIKNNQLNLEDWIMPE